MVLRRKMKTSQQKLLLRWASNIFIKKSMKSSEILEIREGIPEKAGISGLFFVFCQKGQILPVFRMDAQLLLAYKKRTIVTCFSVSEMR